MGRKKVIIKILLFLTLLCIAGGVGWYISLPDYYTHFSFVESNGTNRRKSTLDIIVYKRHHDETLYDEIADEYIEINGPVNKLDLQLFYSKDHMKDNNYYKRVIYDYDNNERIIK